MKILWVNSGFLHPTDRGGQIRTLGTLRELHKRHEIHYLAFEDSAEGVERSGEYSTRAYPVPHRVPPRRSAAFTVQLTAHLLSALPLPVRRYTSRAMREAIRGLRNRERFDAVVCDFLFPSANFDSLDGVILFEHNLETAIWRRHAANAGNPLLRAYFAWEARRMFRYEREVCRGVARVIAVSPVDAENMRREFGVSQVADVPTGVDLEYFRRPEQVEHSTDLVFLGSMDWMPNIDAVEYFVSEILPLIRMKRPECTLAIAGRRPTSAILRLAEADRRIRVTGTVADVRPYLWGAAVSIVPMRVGSGTRLKIYESMAARTAVVSTTVGAEGLEIDPPHDIRIADDPRSFANHCLDLMEHSDARSRVAEAGWNLVSSRFSWEQVARRMEELLR